jgi:adenine-specific DNA-methyltransferase
MAQRGAKTAVETKEQRFFRVLRDLFVGAKVEGESGFVNLMRIKSRYYEQGVFPRLKDDIDRALQPFPEFREELFDRLYTFFHRYFSESGSIYFRFTPPHEHVYEKVYTDDRDVALFWKTHMLYYVKTDRLFQNMEVELDGFRFYFDVSELEHKRANEKRTLVYTFKERRQDGTLVFRVSYSERGRQTDPDAIRRAIRDALGLKQYTSAVPSEETLERSFRLFERQSEVDYFINKNARQFLREQFNLWLYQYVFEPKSGGDAREPKSGGDTRERRSGEDAREQEAREGTLWTERRIQQLQVLKEIAYKIIDFIGQFEYELVKIWNKPKFVLDSHYVITLDRIVAQAGGEAVLKRLLAHPGMEKQVREWRELGIVGEDFTPEEVLNRVEQISADLEEDFAREKARGSVVLNPRYQYLPIDTKHFPDLEMSILALFDHLDQALDGWLVHSENYQALNTMLPKFRGRVKCIYIDPPYNTGNDEFIYNDRFRHSSWLTMMENRLRLAREWMREDGAIFVNIDENEQPRLRILLEELYGSENYVAPMIWMSRAGKGGTGTKIQIGHEHIELVCKDIAKFSLKPVERVVQDCPYQDDKGPYKRELLRQWGGQHDTREERPTLYYPIPTPFGIEVYPERPDGKEGTWRFSREKVMKMLEEGDLDFVKDEKTGKITIYRKVRAGHKLLSVPGNILSDVGTSADGTKMIKALFGEKNYDTAKPLPLVIHLVDLVTWQDTDALILDFFAGSGTTGHAVINLNREDGGKRKYILVEMADYFHTVLLPRIKKVVFSDKWRDGKAQPEGKGISHFVKYFRLESYEEVLRKAHYRDDDATLFYEDPYTQYVFLRDPKMLDNAETGKQVVAVNMERGEIRVNLEDLYPGGSSITSDAEYQGSGKIDLAETLSCLTGKWIRRIHPDKSDATQPGKVEFEDGTEVDLQNPPWELVKPLIWW